jgi:LacI family transcriptional regulator
VASSHEERRITLEDVAREANVSTASVSRVVNNKGYVSEEVRNRVMAALVRTGYVINRQARGLASGKSQVIGLVVPELETSYFGEIIRGIDEELAAVGYDLMLYTTHHRKQRESAHVATLTAGLADGLLLVLPQDPGAYLESFRHRRFPYVLIDHGGIDETGPSVGATNVQGALDGADYLLRLGHRRIGFITGKMHMGCAVDRLTGYRLSLESAGIPYDAELVLEGDFHQPLGYQQACRLLALADRPTAIFASNDAMGFGVMEAVRDAGLRIGHDISIIGFDNVPAASMVHPPLTTVRQPLNEMGRAATRMLLERIAAPDTPVERIDLPTELVVRESCRMIAGP